MSSRRGSGRSLLPVGMYRMMPENAERRLRQLNRKPDISNLSRYLVLGEVLLQDDRTRADTTETARHVEGLMSLPFLLQDAASFRDGYIRGRWDCAVPIFRLTLPLIQERLQREPWYRLSKGVGYNSWERTEYLARITGLEKISNHDAMAAVYCQESQAYGAAIVRDGGQTRRTPWSLIKQAFATRAYRTNETPIMGLANIHTARSTESQNWDAVEWYAGFILSMMTKIENGRFNPPPATEVEQWLRAQSHEEQIWIFYHALLAVHLQEKRFLWVARRRRGLAAIFTALPDWLKYIYDRIWNGGF